MIENVGRAKAGSRVDGNVTSAPTRDEVAKPRTSAVDVLPSPPRAQQRGGAERAEVWGERVLAIDLGPLRYLRDLLSLGVKRALDPRLPLETLRTQRISAGIELAELDTVPLWATQREDAAVAIPFLDLVLDEVLARADRVLDTCAHLTHTAGAPARMTALEIAALRKRVAGAACLPADNAHPFPYLPLAEVEKVCAHGGAVARLVEECQQIRAEALAHCRTLAGLQAGPSPQ
ncbi:MAG: hypothetical protein U0610_30025 [bacterium]